MIYPHPFDPVPEGACCCVYFGDVDMTYTDLACPIHGVNGTHPMGDQQGRRSEIAPDRRDGHDRPEDQVSGDEGEPESHQVDGTQSDMKQGEHEAQQSEQGEHASSLPSPLSSTTASLIGDERALKEALMRWCDSLETFDGKAVGLHQIQVAKGAVAEVEGELVDKLVEDFPLNDRGKPAAWTETTAGLLKTDWKGGYSSWDADALWTVLLDRARTMKFDPATGEVRDGAEVMLELIKEVVASPTFKVTVLRSWGVDVDDYRATSPKRRVVRFVD